MNEIAFFWLFFRVLVLLFGCLRKLSHFLYSHSGNVNVVLQSSLKALW
jgi:hypothetical protein